MAEYKVLKDIVFEKKNKIINYKVGNKLSDADFPTNNFVKGFIKDKSIEVAKSVEAKAEAKAKKEGK